ncbi:MAG: hypothetical protein H7Z17_19780 [Fuerstia sp.]|nr:hypothetical protein [Fuerstiella sp.]
MQNAFSISRIIASIYFAGSIFAYGPSLSAQEPPSLGAIRNHDHAPIIVQSRPVIERLPVKVIEPVDLRIGKNGHIFVADRSAKCVFRLDSDGEVSLPVADLSDIQRIQLDDNDNLYVLTSAKGESQILMVNPIGQSIVLHELTFAATTFVLGGTIGQFVVALKDSNRIVVITTVDDITKLTRVYVYQPVSDLVLNASGQTEALLVTGEVVHIADGGKVTASGFFAPPGSSRLMLQPDGSMLALSGRSDGHAQLTSVSRDQDFQTFASVPEGTQAVGFDALGNLCLANPDLRAITKVTSHFRIPCPHCGRPTDMIFRKDAEPPANAVTRSF